MDIFFEERETGEGILDRLGQAHDVGEVDS
jgi:hypothetical protein